MSIDTVSQGNLRAHRRTALELSGRTGNPAARRPHWRPGRQSRYIPMQEYRSNNWDLAGTGYSSGLDECPSAVAEGIATIQPQIRRPRAAGQLRHLAG